jgi:streptogramin lyase
MKLLVILMIWSIAILQTYAQTIPVNGWKSYTSMVDVRDGDRLGSTIIAATAGGLFRYDRMSSSYTLTTNAEGLSTNDLTAVATDEDGQIWIGGSDGEVHVLDPATSLMRDIPDIHQSPRLQKGIRAFVPHGDTVYIVSAFGVSVFRTDKWEFGDTYANFLISGSPDIRDASPFNDTLWVASSIGLFAGWLGSTNLSAPSSWTTVQAALLPSSDIHALSVYNDTLYAGTAGGLAVHGGSGFITVPSQNGRQVRRVLPADNQVLLLDATVSQSSVIRIAHAFDAGSPMTSSYGAMASDVLYDPEDASTWLTSPGAGLLVYGGGVWRERNPDVPRSGVFVHVAVDKDGVVWSGSGINGAGSGFMRFSPLNRDGDQWRAFMRAEHPQLQSNDYYKVNPTPSGSVWISSWGFGVIEMKDDSIRRKIDTQSSPSLASSVSGSSTFAVIGSVVEDDAGVVWMVNRTAVNGNVLAKLLADGSMEYEKNVLPGGEGRFTSLVIDRYGTKWLANSEPMAKASTGLYFYNEDMSVAGTSSTGGWGVLTQNDGLPNNTVICLVVDQDGDVWVGTDLGVSIITNPRSPRTGRLSSFPLREQSIQSIAVDAVNRKWVGTKEGVFVVSSDGSQLLEHYTVRSTEGSLVDNDVRSLSIDQARGIVYMGTEKGMSALGIAAVASERSYTLLSVGPNPFIIPSAGTLAIKNLVENSTIKIISVDGRKISEFNAQGGGRAFWDGRDAAGLYVASGIYMIVAFAEDGEQVVTGKVAVVRR